MSLLWNHCPTLVQWFVDSIGKTVFDIAYFRISRELHVPTLRKKQHNLDYCNCCKRDENKMKEKNAYFEFQNDGFILSTLFFLLPTIYTNT